MIQDLKPYPSYKPSALSWVGTIPSHWDEKRAKYLFREVDERSRTGTEELLSVSHITGVTPRSQKNVTMFMAESTVGHKVCRPGDLVINTLWAWMGALGVSPLTGLVSPAYGVYRPFKTAPLSSAFIGHLLRLPQYVSEYMCRSTGIQSSRLRLYPEQLLKIPIACPPFDEQRLMLRYLAYVDRRIRRYVAAKRRLIALLNEQKQAIIRRAVTRGVDTNVRLKPSGVEWLGDVPEHWEIARLSQFFTLQRGFDITKDRQQEGVVPVVSSGGISSYHSRATARGPGVVVGRKGTAGSVYYVEGDYWAHDTTLWVNDFKGNWPRFVYCVLAALDLKRLDTGAANPTLNRNVIHPERLAFPSPSEQRLVAREIDANVERNERASVGAQREIDILREYRTRLIADVVTGKLDVREAAAQLPDEAADTEPLDEADALTEGDDLDFDATPEEAEG